MRRGLVFVLVVGAAVTVAAVAAGGTQADDPTAEVVARYPDGAEMVERTVIAPSDVASVDEPRRLTEQWLVSVTLSRDGASSFADDLVDAGFTSRGVAACDADAERNDDGYCLLTVVDGEVVSALGVGESLADSLESGAFEADREFLLLAPDERTANRTARAFGWRPGQPDPPWSTPTTARETTALPAGPDGDGTETSVPGFGALGALLAAVATAALARARR